MTGFVFTLTFAVVVWTEGTRLSPATEAGLLGSAEVPIEILFEWTFLAELPPPIAPMSGGAAPQRSGGGGVHWHRGQA